MNARRKTVLYSLLLLCALLGGCTGSVPLREPSAVTLPPAALKYPAPKGDAQEEFAQTVLLCLPDAVSGQLVMHAEKILVPLDRHPAEATLRKLLAFQQSDALLSLGGKTQLQLASGSGVEISGSVATVNLAAGALLLERRDFFTVSRAIANTLTQWNDIRYVNVLVSGQQPGIDTASTLPAGLMQRTGNEDARALWENISSRASGSLESPETKRFSSVAALYFPVLAGRGVMAEARAISFPGQTQQQMVQALLDALSAGAQTLPAVPAVPGLRSFLLEDPQVQSSSSAGGRVVRLAFDESLNQALITSGIPRSVMMASLTVTITTFLPAAAGVEVTIGDELVSAVIPAGIYDGAGVEIPFRDGIMRRSDFTPFLLDYCVLYFADRDGALTKVWRPVPYFRTKHVRFLINQLMEGPQNCDSAPGLQPVFPAGMGDADLLGVAREADEVLLNFSNVLLELGAGLSPREERLLVYGVINTLTEIPTIRRLRFYIAGAQPETLAGAVYLPGIFMRNPGIVHPR